MGLFSRRDSSESQGQAKPKDERWIVDSVEISYSFADEDRKRCSDCARGRMCSFHIDLYTASLHRKRK